VVGLGLRPGEIHGRQFMLKALFPGDLSNFVHPCSRVSCYASRWYDALRARGEGRGLFGGGNRLHIGGAALEVDEGKIFLRCLSSRRSLQLLYMLAVDGLKA
jgi:hypothetical protein